MLHVNWLLGIPSSDETASARSRNTLEWNPWTVYLSAASLAPAGSR